MSTARTSATLMQIDGMHCAGCAAAVEQALRRVHGVESASVDVLTGLARVVSADPPPPGLLTLAADAVRAAGYSARPTRTDAPTIAAQRTLRDAELAAHRRNLTRAILLGAPVMFLHVGGQRLHAFIDVHSAPLLAAQAALTAATIAAGSGAMVIDAARKLAAGTLGMDLLVSIGMLAALAAGLLGIALDRTDLLLFDSAVMICAFVNIGRYFEARARRHALSALEAMHARTPRDAFRIRDGRVEKVPVDAIAPGDRLHVGSDQLVPVDARIVSGTLVLDESMLTGEWASVVRDPGEVLMGGTRVVEGAAELHALADGPGSTAARIAQRVLEVQQNRPRVQRIADRAASVFVPAVLLIALLTFIGWLLIGSASPSDALLRGLATLVVACPCALGLAIPTAVMVGAARCAEQGILLRSGAALEAAERVRRIWLDKTGTLTAGRPVVASVRVVGRHDPRTMLELAAAAACVSEHPLAQALVRHARDQGVQPSPPQQHQSIAGRGIRAQVDARQVVLGSPQWVRSLGVADAPAEDAAEPESDRGRSVVWVAIDAALACVVTFDDPLHADAAESVRKLRELGLEVGILSGDRTESVRSVAERLGVTRYEGELSPDDKLRRVRDSAADGTVTAMVGDGVNDAPALGAAGFSVAIGAGANLARESADVCLIGHAPLGIVRAIRIARRSAAVMRQNLAWACVYNAVMTPIAIFTAIPPSAATAAMMLSSFSVVANSLRLRRA